MGPPRPARDRRTDGHRDVPWAPASVPGGSEPGGLGTAPSPGTCPLSPPSHLSFCFPVHFAWFLPKMCHFCQLEGKAPCTLLAPGAALPFPWSLEAPTPLFPHPFSLKTSVLAPNSAVGWGNAPCPESSKQSRVNVHPLCAPHPRIQHSPSQLRIGPNSGAPVGSPECSWSFWGARRGGSGAWGGGGPECSGAVWL